MWFRFALYMLGNRRPNAGIRIPLQPCVDEYESETDVKDSNIAVSLVFEVNIAGKRACAL